MRHQKIKLSLLSASSQPRAIDPTAIDQLAASIKELGLINPITVRESALFSRSVASATGGYQTVAGHHRAAAVRALGWEEIDAIVLPEIGGLEAELIEIDENLVRSELTPAQHDHYKARRKDIWEALHPAPSRDYSLESYDTDDGEFQVEPIVPPEIGYKKPPPQTKGFAASTAELTGETKQSINRSVARAEAIGPNLLRVVGTSLDKVAELTALAKLPEPERTALIERAEAGEKVTARPAPAPLPIPAVNEQDGPANGLALVRCLDVMLAELLKRTGYDEVEELAQALSLIRGLDAANAELLQQCLNEFAQVGRCSTAPALS